MATRLPSALWPVAGKSTLKHLLARIVNSGIDDIVICSSQDKSLLAESIQIDKNIKIEFLDEPLPAGTAGSIRKADTGRPDSLYLLFTSSMIYPPDINALINEHIKSESDMTVVLEPAYSGNCKDLERACGIYICNSSVLELIPPDGYFDIKEGLIPKMLRAGKNINTLKLKQQTGNFRNCHEYLNAVSNNIKKIAEDNNIKLVKSDKSCKVWSDVQTHIDPSAIIAGEVILLEGANISEDTVLIGPSVLGRNVFIGKGSIINRSVLWDNSRVMENCSIEGCVLDYDVNLRSYTNVAEQCIERRTRRLPSSPNNVTLQNAKYLLDALVCIPVKIKQMFPEKIKMKTQKALKYSGVILILISFIWSYWDGIKDLWNIWMRSDEYSSGLLVPFLAVYVLWLRRQEIMQINIKPSIAGLFLFILAQALRIFGMFFIFSSAERYSIIIKYSRDSVAFIRLEIICQGFNNIVIFISHVCHYQTVSSQQCLCLCNPFLLLPLYFAFRC